MQWLVRRISVAVLVGLVPLVPLQAAVKHTVPVIVEGVPQTAPDRFVIMTGVGTIRAMPDTAVISGGVITRARRAGDALRANSEAMAKTVAALKALGIAEKQIATSSFSFEPQYETDSKGNIDPDRRIVGYSVSNQIAVTLTEQLERAGDVLDALIQNGANDSSTIAFEIRDREALEMRARAEAGKNALQRAQAYANALGVELGAVRSVREGRDSVAIVAEDIGSFPDNDLSESLQRIPGVQVRVTAGEQTITQVVTVVWALK